MPKTSKNSFQNVCFSALSLFAPAQSRANWMAFWRISFQEMGMAFCGTDEVTANRLAKVANAAILRLSTLPRNCLSQRSARQTSQFDQPRLGEKNQGRSVQHGGVSHGLAPVADRRNRP